MIYFDNSATTKPYDEALQTYTTAAANFFGNASSLHGLGGQAERLLTQSRQVCSSLLNVKPSEIIFTSGGTEGNNTAIKGVASQYKNRGNHLITSVVEHAATYETFQQLEKDGYDVTYLPVDNEGRISVQELERSIRDDTILVSLIHVNNELGTIQPIEEVARMLRNYPKVLFHVDHVQGIGKVPLDFAGIDLCTMSGHKFHGVKGTGILFVRDGVKLTPLLHGGGQEMKYRSGTENVPGIAAMTKALRLSLEHAANELNRLEKMKQYLIEQLAKLPGVYVNTPEAGSAPHIINFSVPGVKPEVLIHSLEEHEIYVSSQSACSSKLAQASRILLAANFDKARSESGIRVSFSYHNTEQEVEKFINTLKLLLPNLQKVMG